MFYLLYHNVFNATYYIIYICGYIYIYIYIYIYEELSILETCIHEGYILTYMIKYDREIDP